MEDVFRLQLFSVRRTNKPLPKSMVTLNNEKKKNPKSIHCGQAYVGFELGDLPTLLSLYLLQEVFNEGILFFICSYMQALNYGQIGRKKKKEIYRRVSRILWNGRVFIIISQNVRFFFLRKARR